MNILTKLFNPFVRSYDESKTTVAEEKAEKNALNAKLSSATGLDSVIDIVTQEKKDRKSRQEKKDMRDQILSL